MKDENAATSRAADGTPTEEQRQRNGRPDASERFGVPLRDTEPKPVVVEPEKQKLGKGLAICASGFVPPVEVQAAELVNLRERADMERGGRPATSEGFFKTVLGYEKELVFRKVRVETVEDFFLCLEQGGEVLSRVVFIGHGTPAGVLGLAGELLANDVKISVRVDKAAVQALAKDSPKVMAIRSRLTTEAICDLCTCDVGRSTEFVQSLADLLDRPVRAFQGKVVWKRKLIQLQLGKDRGRTKVQPTGLLEYYDYDERGITRTVGRDGDGLTVQQLFEAISPDFGMPRRAKKR